MSQHTKEPWQVVVRQTTNVIRHEFDDQNGVIIAMGQSDADARRIVACVNELAGKPEGYVKALENQRDELLAALKEVKADAGYHLKIHRQHILELVEEAIAKAVQP